MFLFKDLFLSASYLSRQIQMSPLTPTGISSFMGLTRLRDSNASYVTDKGSSKMVNAFEQNIGRHNDAAEAMPAVWSPSMNFVSTIPRR